MGLRRLLVAGVFMNARVANNLTLIHTVSMRGTHLVHSRELAHHTVVPSLHYVLDSRL